MAHFENLHLGGDEEMMDDEDEYNETEEETEEETEDETQGYRFTLL